MKHKVRKLFINFEKEEQWLNEMAAKGFHFIDYSIGRYLFEEGTPGEYIYRLELLEKLPSHVESKAYINFMEESGIECVGTYFRWVYFRKKSSEGPFDLYSNFASRIRHYKRVATLIGIAGAINLYVAFSNTIIGLTGASSFILYLSIINWILVVAIIPQFIKYMKKIFKMKKESQLYE